MTYDEWDAARRADYPYATHEKWDTWQQFHPEHPASWNPSTGRSFLIENLECDDENAPSCSSPAS